MARDDSLLILHLLEYFDILSYVCILRVKLLGLVNVLLGCLEVPLCEVALKQSLVCACELRIDVQCLEAVFNGSFIFLQLYV